MSNVSEHASDDCAQVCSPRISVTRILVKPHPLLGDDFQRSGDISVSETVEISSFSSPHVNMSISNHSTTRKSWRSDAPIILPGWECHTGGSRSKPTVHRCRPKTGGCGLLTRTQDEPTKNNRNTTCRAMLAIGGITNDGPRSVEYLSRGSHNFDH